MSIVRSLLAKVGFQIDENGIKRFNERVGRTKKELTVASRNINRATRNLNGLAFAAKAAAAAWIGSAVVRSVTTDFTNNAAAAERMAKSLGVSVEFFTGFEHVLSKVGIEGEETGQIIADISERIFDAGNGSKALAEDFGQLGLSVADLKEMAKDPETAILKLADAMKAAGPGAKRTFAAMSGLGDVGAKMLPILEQGSEGIKRMTREAAELGLVMDKDTAAASKRFNLSLGRLKGKFKGLRNELAAKLLPMTTKIVEAFSKWAIEGKGVERSITRLKQAIVLLIPVIAALMAMKLAGWFALIKTSVLALVAAIKSLGLAFFVAKAKIAAIGVGILFALLVLEDFIGFVRGNDSVIGRMFGDDNEIVNAFREALIELGKAFADLWDGIKPLFTTLLKAFSPLAKALLSLFKMLIPEGATLGKILSVLILGPLIVFTKVLTVIVNLLVMIIEDGIKPIARIVGGEMLEFWRDLKGLVTDIAGAIAGAFMGAIKGAASSLKTTFGPAWDWVKAKGIAAAKATGRAFKTVWAGFKERFPGVASFLEKVWKGIVKNGKKAWASLRDYAIAAARKVQSAWERARKAAKGIAGKAKTLVSDLTSARQTLSFAPVPTAPTAAETAGSRPAGATPAGATPPASNNVSVGAVNVKVEGSVDMSSTEMQSAIERGAGRAVNRGIRNAFKDRAQTVKPATEGAT